MKIVHHIEELRQTLAPFQRPAFVPTMGNLHAGHIALVEQARIANLVGLLRDTFASHQALEALSDVATAQSGQLISLRPDIAAALGIETGAGDE